MIGKLKGVIDEIGEDHVVVDVHGVGYVAFCSMRTLGNLPGAGEAVTLFIETYVREDMIRLFGFQSHLERDWFRLLQSVQGVGAKVALAVLSTLDRAGPRQCHRAARHRHGLPRARRRQEGGGADCHGTEEQGPGLCRLGSGTIGLKQELGEGVAPAPVMDAVSALTNLGYSRDVAANAVAAAMKVAGEGADLAKLIRFGLKELAR